MDITTLVAVGVCLVVVALSGFLYFLMSLRNKKTSYPTLEDQVEAIELTGKKKKPFKAPKRTKKSDPSQESPKVHKEPKVKTEAGQPSKESPLRKVAGEKKKTTPKVEEESQPSPKSSKNEGVAGETKGQSAVKKEPQGARSEGKGDKRQRPLVEEDTSRKSPDTRKAEAKPVPAETKKSEARGATAQPKKTGTTEEKGRVDTKKPEITTEAKKVEAKVGAADTKKTDVTDGDRHGKHKSKVKSSVKPTGSFFQLREQIDQVNLSEDELHSLIEILLAKRQENEAWQEAGTKVTTSQQLRKQLDEMTAKYEEARSSAEVFAMNVKKLRSDLVTETSRHQHAESSAQAQLARLTKENTSLKTRIQKAEEEEKEQQQPSSGGPEESLANAQVLEGMKKEIARLNECLNQSEKVKSTLEADNKSLGIAVAENQAKVDELSKVNNANVQSLQDRSSVIEEENRKLKDQLSKKDVEAAEAIRKLKEEVKQLKEDLEQNRDENERLGSDITEKNFTIQSLQTQVQTSKTAMNSGWADKVKELEVKTAQLEKEKTDLISAQMNHENTMKNLEDASMRQKESLEDEKKKLSEQVDEQKERIEQLIQRQDQLQASLTASETLASADTDVVGELKQKNSELLEDAAQLRDKVAKLEGELKAYEQQQQQQQQEVQLPAPVEESDGGFISKLVYTEEVTAKDKEIEGLREQVATFEQEKKSLELKMQGLKQKNNELYDKSWKVSDELSALKKRAEEDVRTAERSAEDKWKAAIEDKMKEEQENTKAKLTELIPGVQVEESGSFENWLESFVESVVPAVTANGSKSPSLPLPEANVDELETALKEKEKSEAELKENVSQLTETLQRTRDSLANLQGHVESKISLLSNELQETKKSLDQEKNANRSLCKNLEEEREKVSELQHDLDTSRRDATAAEVNKTKLQELESQVEELTEKLKQQTEKTTPKSDEVKEEVDNPRDPLPSEETEV